MPFLLIFLLTALAQYFIPWWGMAAVIPFAVAAWRSRSAGGAFGAGFLAVGLLWLLVAGWQSHANDNLLADRMAQVLPLGGSTTLLLAVTALLGGLVGGISAWAGYLARAAFSPKMSPSRN
ncbi:MAG: hypothetical protein H7Y12_09935 [Sphingobacteriaceae bacterium]|nr:hypothetical protein [Cytophagaceae bacterium]